MRIEVAYVLLEQQTIIALEVSDRDVVRNAILQSGILALFPEIDLNKIKVGIFSKKVTLDHPLREGDRIEIYRPLIMDPKQARRRRADIKTRS